MADPIFLSKVRLSFPHIAEPQVNKTGGRISYNCELILAPNNPDFVKFMDAVGALAAEKWGARAHGVLGLINQDRKKRCFGNGDDKINTKTFKPYEGYAGHIYITAGRDTMPQIINPDGTAVNPENSMVCKQVARMLYGGCYVNAAVKPWLQDNEHGQGVRCDLVAIQFHSDGVAFGEGAADASGMFGAVAAAPAGVPTPAGMPAAPFAQAPAPGLPSFLQ